jgi:hypothetical protein
MRLIDVQNLTYLLRSDVWGEILRERRGARRERFLYLEEMQGERRSDLGDRFMGG